MRNLEIRHLRYFVAVAEARSVMAGARVVGIAQPALSRQMRELEEVIGTALLVRTSRGVDLTAAGESFLRDAVQLLSELKNSQQRALRASRGEIGELRLGVLPNYLTLPVFARALQVFRAAYPGVTVSVEPMLSATQVRAMAGQQIDGGVMAWRACDAPHLKSVLLLQERFVLALPMALVNPNHLPQTLTDLKDLAFVGFDPIRSPAQHRFLTAQCDRAGFTPCVAQIGSDIPTLMGLVAAGMGCAFVPESVAQTCPAHVMLVGLDELKQTFDVEFAYDSQAPTPVTLQFVALLERESARDDVSSQTPGPAHR
jgi:DNA-binding transcriptional LysR family regulator